MIASKLLLNGVRPRGSPSMTTLFPQELNIDCCVDCNPTIGEIMITSIVFTKFFIYTKLRPTLHFQDPHSLLHELVDELVGMNFSMPLLMLGILYISAAYHFPAQDDVKCPHCILHWLAPLLHKKVYVYCSTTTHICCWSCYSCINKKKFSKVNSLLVRSGHPSIAREQGWKKV